MYIAGLRRHVLPCLSKGFVRLTFYKHYRDNSEISTLVRMNEMRFQGIRFAVYVILTRGMKMNLFEFERMAINGSRTTRIIVHLDGMSVVDNLTPNT